MQVPEAPWHLRKAAHELHLRHRALLQVHRLTEAWARELDGCPRDLSAQIQTLSPLREHPLEHWLDDTQPADVMWRLERTVWSLHAHLLRVLVNPLLRPGRDLTGSAPSALAENLGKAAAEADWGKFVPGRIAGSRPVSRARRDLSRLILALSSTPFAHPILVARATPLEASFELLRCAHQSPFPEVLSLSDPLCAMHASWLQGFARGLNPGIQVEYGTRSGRCRQRWILADED